MKTDAQINDTIKIADFIRRQAEADIAFWDKVLINRVLAEKKPAEAKDEAWMIAAHKDSQHTMFNQEMIRRGLRTRL